MIQFLIGGATQYMLACILGALPGLLLAAVSIYFAGNRRITWVWVIAAIVIAAAGAFVAAAFALIREFLKKVPDNGFGLVSGMPDDGPTLPAGEEPLTLWLTQYINELAGLGKNGRPLTFGDLWHLGKELTPAKQVNLEMMTTNLTHGRPFRLPFRDDGDLRENYLFYFRKDDLLTLFPRPVVEWMVEHPRPIRDETKKALQDRKDREDAGFYPLPAPAGLPVVVATRMSLSFPVLLSAIPLYAIDYTKPEEYRIPERCWFTDGGVCSNFPMHFFDGTLPRRPTFSIDLTQQPDDTPDAELLPEMDNANSATIVMDRWNRFDVIEHWDPAVPVTAKSGFGQVMGFAGTLISTMQNWNDATQGRLPGYRDRIARIPMTSRQGGLNLDMQPEVVEFLAGQGSRCAEVLIEHFDVPPAHQKMTWDNHRWIRMRAMLASLEKMVGDTMIGYEQAENGDKSYADWLAGLNASPDNEIVTPSYRPTKDQVKAAIGTLEKIREIKDLWGDDSAANGAPRPRPVLRPRPQI
jgi:hypothetical protein